MTSTMYLPWLRTGVAGYLPAPGAGVQPADAALQVAVALVDGDAAQPTQEHTVTIRGPGHVVALDPRVVVREEPPRQAREVAPTTFPHVELREPDLPWRHTPLGPDARGRIPPWIVLVCVRVQDGVAVVEDPRTRRPTLQVAKELVASELPDLREAWAWAHVQIAGIAEGVDPIGDGTRRPAGAIARLVCPRRLQPFSRYVCAVVPAYQAGVEAARGEVPATQDLTPAWSSTPAQDLALPTLHAWSFTTGEAEDLQTLVLRMRVRPAPADLGERPLTLLPLGLGGVEPAPDARVPLRGALRAPPVGADSPVERATPAALEKELAGLWTVAAQADDADDPVVTPPQYARAAASDPPPPWLAQLNHHPAHRTAAGLGAEAVQRHQEELVAAAWDQLEQARSAAIALRQAQLAAEIGRTQASRLATMPAGDRLQLTARSHARVQDASGMLVRARLLADGLPEGALAPRIRRWTRPRAATPHRRDDARAASPAGRFAATLLAAPAVAQQATGFTRPLGLMRAAASAATRTPAARTTEPFALALRPLTAHVERLQARLTGAAPPLAPGDGLPDALRLLPRLDVPLSRWLVDIDPELILPGLGAVPDDTVMVLAPNRPFVEAVLAGASDALARELAWREFPVDPRGTAFQVFWDGADGADIRPLREWRAALGQHAAATKEANRVGAAVLLRGAVLRRYPNLRIYLGRRLANGTIDVEPPIGAGQLTSDTSYALFPVSPEALTRDWWLVLEEEPGAPRFGLDAGAVAVAGAPNWSRFPAAEHAPVADPTKWGAKPTRWDSGALAGLTLQRPVRYALELAKLLTPGDA